MSRTVPGAGVDLRCEERGAGTPIVLVHGLAADHETLLDLAAALAADGRVIAYSRRGYGGSGVPEPYNGTTVAEQAEDARAVLDATQAAGAVGVGDGFGALIVLDLLLRHPGLLSAAVLVDPPLFAFVPEATRALSQQRAEIEAAVRADGPRAGVAVWLGDRADSEAAARAQDAHRAFYADYAGLASLPVTRRELRAIDVPVAVVTGPDSAAHVVAAADAIAQLVPQARRAGDGDVIAAVRSLLQPPR